MKKVIAVFLAALFLFSFVACSSGSEEGVTESTAADVSDGENQSRPERNFDFENMTIGKITKISGNQVTLELGTVDKESMTMPEGMSRPEDFDPENMPEGMSRPENFDPEDMPEGFDPENMPEGMSRPENFDPENMPEGFDPENMPAGFGGKGSSGGGMFGGFDVEVEYTGETAKYTIPSEVKVGNGDYTSLSEGMVIGLGFDEDGIVNSVMIISGKGN